MKNESRLLGAKKKLDRDALIAVFDTYASAIYSYVLRLCGDAAESDETVGRVFAQLLEKVTAGKGLPANLRSYLYQAAYRSVTKQGCYSPYLASREVVSSRPQDLLSAFVSSAVAESALMDKFASAFNNALSDLQRHVLILRFLEDFSLDETATIIGTTVNQVKAIQNLGLTILRSHFDLLSDGKE